MAHGSRAEAHSAAQTDSVPQCQQTSVALRKVLDSLASAILTLRFAIFQILDYNFKQKTRRPQMLWDVGMLRSVCITSRTKDLGHDALEDPSDDPLDDLCRISRKPELSCKSFFQVISWYENPEACTPRQD